ncbi:MAG: hypothetical protein MUF33_07115 [Candidatus Nanopelagicales bacterium]|nr:hypothetical protein [Candidatus Nanopelagicales bacterium]MCU0296553.1 hypothetical protein [Candidatus Nanopelagicales bacterium]MCU0298275.1 hypothetical protein [Candidatus Nanopelagicales bacterium]
MSDAHILARAADPADDPLSAGTPRPALTAISVKRAGSEVSATASLTLGGRTMTGRATRHDGDRERTIATATLAALTDMLPTGVELESSQVIAIPGRTVALTVVRFPDGSGRQQPLVGSALVRGEVEDALARSVLSALNRRLNG